MSLELSQPTLDSLRQAIEALARQAGAAIMAVYQAPDFQQALQLQYKADASPLTAADLAAQRIISSGLAKLEPALPQLSEESAHTPWAERQHWQHYWLIDPLDGSKEFLQRNGEFTVNIALIVRGQALLGVVYAPALDTLYSGCVNSARAWRNGTRIASPGRWCGLGLKRVLVSRSHRGAEQAAANEQLIALGSSLKFTALASGEADEYTRLGPTCEWDTAAGQAVLEAAGGSVCDLSGQPLRYNQKESLLNPYFRAHG